MAQPLAELQRDQRKSMAYADRQYNLANTSAVLTETLARAQAVTGLEAALATSRFAQVSALSDEPYYVSLPSSVAPPTYNLPAIYVISDSYAVWQLGSINDDFYFYSDWGYWRVRDHGWGEGRYHDGWGEWGPGDYYAGSYWGLGTYYGHWAYGPDAFGWGGWSSGYTTSPQGLGSGFTIDVDGALADYAATVEGLIAPTDISSCEKSLIN